MCVRNKPYDVFQVFEDGNEKQITANDLQHLPVPPDVIVKADVTVWTEILYDRFGVDKLSEFERKYGSLKDVDLNKQDDFGNTVIYYAARNADLMLVKRLHEAGASLFSTSASLGKNVMNDRSVLMAAVEGASHWDVDENPEPSPVVDYVSRRFRILFRHDHSLYLSAVNFQDQDGNTVLHIACKQKQANMLVTQNLLKAGVDLHVRNAYGHTALHEAVIAGHLGVVRFLRAKGLSLFDLNAQGQTILHLASDAGHLHLVKYCLKNNVGLTQQDDHRRTALDAAINAFQVHVVRYLISRGAKFDRPDLQDILTTAVKTGNAAMVDFLCFGGGANANGVDEGTPLLIIAIKRGHVDVVEALIDVNADRNLPGNKVSAMSIMRLLPNDSGFLNVNEIVNYFRCVCCLSSISAWFTTHDANDACR